MLLKSNLYGSRQTILYSDQTYRVPKFRDQCDRLTPKTWRSSLITRIIEGSRLFDNGLFPPINHVRTGDTVEKSFLRVFTFSWCTSFIKWLHYFVDFDSIYCYFVHLWSTHVIMRLSRCYKLSVNFSALVWHRSDFYSFYFDYFIRLYYGTRLSLFLQCISLVSINIPVEMFFLV